MATTTTTAKATETKTTEKRSVFMNYVSDNMARERTATKDGKENSFISLSFPCDKSATGYGSITVNTKQRVPSTLKNGEVKTGYHNYMLGAAAGKRKVSIATAVDENGKATEYGEITLTNEEILAMFEADRKAYKASKATAKAEA